MQPENRVEMDEIEELKAEIKELKVELAKYRRLEKVAANELEKVGEHSLHNVACYMDAIRKIEDLEQQLATLRHVKKYEIERQKAELDKFQECIYSNGCHDDAGKYYSLLRFTWDTEEPNRAVYHKEGE